MTSVGKVLSPVFLLMLFAVFVLTSLTQWAMLAKWLLPAYQHASFFNGFLQGSQHHGCFSRFSLWCYRCYGR